MDSIFSAPLWLLLVGVYYIGFFHLLTIVAALAATAVTLLITRMPESRFSLGMMKIGIYIFYSTILQAGWLLVWFASHTSGNGAELYPRLFQTVAFLKYSGNTFIDGLQLSTVVVTCVLVLFLPTFRNRTKLFGIGPTFVGIVCAIALLSIALSWPAIFTHAYKALQAVTTNTGVIADSPKLCPDFDSVCIGSIAIERKDPSICQPLVVNEEAYIGCVYAAGGGWSDVEGYCSDDGVHNTRCLHAASRFSSSDPIADQASLARKEVAFCPVLYGTKEFTQANISTCFFSAGGIAISRSGTYQARIEGDQQNKLQVQVSVRKGYSSAQKPPSLPSVSLPYKVVSTPVILGWDGDERFFVLVNKGSADPHLYQVDLRTGISEIPRPNKRVPQLIRAVPSQEYIEFIGYEDGKMVRDTLPFSKF